MKIGLLILFTFKTFIDYCLCINMLDNQYFIICLFLNIFCFLFPTIILNACDTISLQEEKKG